MRVRTQLILVIALLATGFGAFTATYFPARQKDASFRALAQQLVSLETLASDLLGPSILFEDTEGINNTASYILKIDVAAFVVVWNTENTVLVSSARKKYRKQLDRYIKSGSPEKWRAKGLTFRAIPIRTEAGVVGTLGVAFSRAKAEEEAAANQQLSLLIAGGFLFIGLIIALFVAVTMVGPLAGITTAFVKLGEGIIGEDAPEKGAAEFVALARAFNQVGKVLRNVFRETGATSENLGMVIKTLEQDSGTIRTGADGLGKAVSEVGTSVEEIASQIQSVTESSEQLATNMQSASQETILVQDGANEMRNRSEELRNQFAGLAQTLDRLLSGLGDVNTEIKSWESQAHVVVSEAHAGQGLVNEILQQIHKSVNIFRTIRSSVDGLSEEIEHIGEVIGGLQAISDRTHILALNASIEAARAGAAGKGFSVVAQEIRKLAVQSVSSVKTVEESVERILLTNSEVSRSVESNAKEVEKDLLNVEEATGKLVKIVQEVQQIVDLTETLSRNVGEQEQTVQGVTGYIDEVRRFSDIVTDVSEQQFNETTSINEAMTSLLHLGAQIKEATREQYNGGQLILRAIQNVDQSAKDSQLTAQNLEKTVHEIIALQRTLQEVVGFFKEEKTV